MNLFDLPERLRLVCAFLEGRDPPGVDVLERLADISPHFRITWTPGTLDRVVGGIVIPGRPGSWKLWETRPNNPHDALRRTAGYSRMQRLRKRSVARQIAMDPANEEFCRAMMNGLHYVNAWPEHTVTRTRQVGRRVVKEIDAGFGSDRMFYEIAQAEHAVREALSKLDTAIRKDEALDDAADADTLSELDEDPELRTRIRDLYRQAATEDWGVVFQGRSGTLFEKTLKGDDHGTDGQPLAGSGQNPESGRLVEAAGTVGK